MIYICIPTHNEQQTVGVVLWKLKQVLTDFPRDYQLLVADDASTDKTAEVLEPYTRVLPLTVIRSEQRQGSAASLEMLLREAVRRSEYPKRDAIITLQADFSEEPDDLVPLVKRLEAGADVAVGNKVSTSKDTRARRFARSLARFFMRRQKWPEGVMTPFDGYRAYRLYAIKRAIEERGASRLLCYDGWAGNAEMLRAVLPHARRVDVVDIDDRPDRLQRPRREKPFAAAMQVRVMAAGAEPERLVGVEELDRIALTTSRSRERAAITAQSIHAERGSSSRTSGSSSRTNGSRTRQNGQRRDQSRPRSQSNGAARGGTSESRPRRERPQAADGQTRKGGAPSTQARPRQGQATQARTKRTDAQREPREETAAAATAADPNLTADGPVEGAVSPDATPRPKRKRRRRKRGGQGGAVEAGQDQSAGQDAAGTRYSAEAQGSNEGRDADGAQADGQNADAGSEASDTQDAANTGAKKRRRRGGRRGGRGRRKTRTEGAAESGPEGTAEPRAEGATEPGVPSAGEQGGGSGGVAASGMTNPAESRAARPDERPADRAAERPVAEPAARADND